MITTAAAALIALAVTVLAAYVAHLRGEVDALRREVLRLSRQHPAHPSNTGAMIAPLMFHSRN